MSAYVLPLRSLCKIFYVHFHHFSLMLIFPCRLFNFAQLHCVNLQETAGLEGLLKHIKLKEFREFCASLLSNQIGGLGSRLRIDANLSTQRQTLLELLVHLDSVLLNGNSLLVPLHQIASQPQNVTVRCFLFWVAIDIQLTLT